MFLWMCIAESKPGQFGWNRRAIMQSTVIGRPAVCGEERKAHEKGQTWGRSTSILRRQPKDAI